MIQCRVRGMIQCRVRGSSDRVRTSMICTRLRGKAPAAAASGSRPYVSRHIYFRKMAKLSRYAQQVGSSIRLVVINVSDTVYARVCRRCD
jgi:hypothetical protein